MLKSNYSSLSRREFLTTAVGAGGAMLLGPAWLSAAGDGVDPRVAQVMSTTIGIDMHNHVSPRDGTASAGWPAAAAGGATAGSRPFPGRRAQAVRAYRRLCELRA